MTTLTNIALFHARPGRSDELGAGLLALVAPSRREAGCLQYDICRAQADADTWLVFEHWRSCADFDLHMRTDYVRRLLDSVPALCTDGVDLRHFQMLSPHAAAPAGSAS